MFKKKIAHFYVKYCHFLASFSGRSLATGIPANRSSYVPDSNIIFN